MQWYIQSLAKLNLGSLLTNVPSFLEFARRMRLWLDCAVSVALDLGYGFHVSDSWLATQGKGDVFGQQENTSALWLNTLISVRLCTSIGKYFHNLATSALAGNLFHNISHIAFIMI